MRTIVLVTIVMLYSITAYSQKFVYFDEFEKYPTRSEICLKKQKPLIYSGKGGCMFTDNAGFFKQAASDFFKVFKELTPEELEIFKKIGVHLNISNQFKADYVGLVFEKKDRAYILQQEKLFCKWVKSFENMNAYKASFIIEGPATRGYITFPVKSLFKEEYRE